MKQKSKILLLCKNEDYKNDLMRILKDYRIEETLEGDNSASESLSVLLILTDQREMTIPSGSVPISTLFICPQEEPADSLDSLPPQFRDIITAPFIPSVVLRRVEAGIRETRLHWLLDEVPCHIYVKNRQGRYLTANKTFADSLGLQTEEILRENQTDTAPEKREVEITSLDDNGLFFTGEKKYSIQERYRDSQGSTHWLQTVKIPCPREIYGEEALIGAALDITPQKETEEAIRQDRKHFQSVLKSLGEGIIVIDAGRFITSMNPAAENLTGWKQEDAVGEPFDRIFPLIHAGTGTPLKNPIEESAGKTAHLAAQTILRSRTGKEHRIAGTSAPIRTMEGKVSGAVMIFRDISAGETRKQEFPYKEKMNTAREMAGRIACDFHRFLGVLLPASALLQQLTTDNEEARQSVETIQTTSRQANDLTEKLLVFSGKKTNPLVSVDIHDIVKNVISDLGAISGKDIKLKFSLETQEALVTADSSALQDALLQIGINAVEAMPEGGTLEISWGERELDAPYRGYGLFELPPGNYTYLSVSDTGSGISPEIRSRIFDPFITTKPQSPGAGLGLSSAYAIVSYLKGAIEVDSHSGEGTTVSILLPGATEKKQEAPVEVPPKKSSAILLVEDEPVLRKVLSDVLEKEGLTVMTAEDGKKGLFQFKRHPEMFDLIIMDMIMPEMTGIESYDAIKSINPDMKVLFTSGYFRDKNLKEITESEQTAFLEKPFNRETLIKRVREMLARTSHSEPHS